MSPLWTDRVHIALCPDRLVVVRFAPGLRRKAVHKEIVRCGEAPGGGWEAPLAALRAFLGKAPKAEMVLILSNHFVRYSLVPWSDGLDNEAEWRTYVLNAFKDTFGAVAQGWKLRWSEGPIASPCLASAVDRDLLSELRQACKTAGWRLHSIQPYLMAAYNHWRDAFGKGAAWFVLLEAGRLCLLRLDDGRWRWLRCARLGSAPGQEIADMIERGRALSGAGPGAPSRLLVHGGDSVAPSWLREAAGELTSLALRTPPGCSLPEDDIYSMALVG